jgi:DUF4097 and DUF4098 domain-containing protein YvlB
MQKTFETPGPTSLYVALSSGDITVQAGETTETTVNVDGRDADEAVVEQRGDQIVVQGPRRTGFFNTVSALSVRVSLPTGSDLATKSASAGLVAEGRLGHARLRSASGEIRAGEFGGDVAVETGSGDVEIDRVEGDLRIKSGSGEVTVVHVDGPTSIVTGSGDVAVEDAGGQLVVKSGSGDIAVRRAGAEVSATTASGDVHVGAIQRGVLKARAVSGDVHVGVPAGIPVWTDVSAVTGSVSSNLAGAGQPEEGQDFIEIRANSVSGDIRLQQI